LRRCTDGGCPIWAIDNNIVVEVEDSMADWHRVADEADLMENMPLPVRVGDLAIAVVRLEDGIFAINDICTHEYALLSDGYCEDGKLECPLHQACFDIRTGAALNEPAEVPVATYKVKVEAGGVFIEA
jgi:nitrite reductase/ring-hydroxylating ferredoxin subunit